MIRSLSSPIKNSLILMYLQVDLSPLHFDVFFPPRQRSDGYDDCDLKLILGDIGDVTSMIIESDQGVSYRAF